MAAAKKAPTPAPAPTAAPAAAPAEKAKPEKDPNVVTLAELCTEIGIAGTAARRKLRAKKVNKDGRWQWQKDSKELAAVRELLIAKDEPKAEAPAAATKQ